MFLLIVLELFVGGLLLSGSSSPPLVPAGLTYPRATRRAEVMQIRVEMRGKVGASMMKTKICSVVLLG